jgi:hypothetical protein
MNILPKNIGNFGSVEVTFSSYQKVKGLRTSELLLGIFTAGMYVYPMLSFFL